MNAKEIFIVATIIIKELLVASALVLFIIYMWRVLYG